MEKKSSGRIYLILIVFFLIASLCVILFSGREKPAAPEVTAPVLSAKPDKEVVYREVEKLVEVEKKISASELQSGLNDMGLLVTEEYYFTEVMSFSNVKKLLKTSIELGFTETSYLASYDGIVTAGIDFSAIRVEKDDENGTVTISLPKAGILSVDIDPASFQLYSEKSGIGNPLSVEDVNTSLTVLEDTAKEKAVERGLLEHADENAERLIRNFVSGLIDPTEYELVLNVG